MIKIVQVSDIHIRPLERHEEYRYVFSKLFEELRRIKPDLIINTGDTWHTKLQHITPEGFKMIRWLLTGLAEFAPTYHLYGNHDLNLQNKDRHNIFAEALKAAAEDPETKNKIVLLDKSERVTHTFDNGKKVIFHPFSITDTKNWETLEKEFETFSYDKENDVNIALFHGSVYESMLQNGYTLKEAELEKDNFLYKFPFAFLGDIHLRQNLAFRKTKDGDTMPYSAYAGSVIQQDFGESIDGHGFIVWNINNESDWTIDNVDIDNPYKLISFPWLGVENTYKAIKEYITKENLTKKISIRIQHGGVIFATESKTLEELLKMNFDLDHVYWSYSKGIEDNIIEYYGSELKPNTETKSCNDLFNDYIDKNPAIKVALQEEDYEEITKHILDFESKAQIVETNTAKRSVWKIKELWFDNLYMYNEGNYINFETYKGNIGIFGPNRIGKSALLGAVCYGLYNASDRGALKGFDIINENKQFCRAKVRFEIGGESYFVERVTKKGKGQVTNTKVNFYKTDSNGITTVLNGDKGTDTDKNIRKIIGTFEDFEITSLAAQRNLYKFVQQGSTECKKALARYFNIDSYLKIGDLALDEKKKYAELIKNKTDNSFSSEKEQYVEAIDNLQEEILHKNLTQENIKSIIQKLNDDLRSMNVTGFQEYKTNEQLIIKSARDIESYNQKILEATRKLDSLGGKELEHKNEIEKYSKDVDSYKTAVSSLTKIKDNLEKILKEESKQKKKLTLLDEIPCGDQYPSCSFIVDSFKAKALLPEIEASIASTNELLRLQEGSLSQFPANLDVRYRSATEALERVSREIKDHNHTISFLQKKISEETEYQETLLKKRNELIIEGCNEDIEEKIKNITNEIKLKNNELSSIRNEITTLASDNKMFETKLGLWETKFEEYKGHVKMYRVFSVIGDAFSKNGIPAQILRDYTDSINFFSGLVTKDTDFDIKVRVDSESNSLDIDYVYNGKTRPVETCCGVEKTFAALALRVAMIQCSSIPVSNSLFLDECFGALDEEMIVVGKQLLTSLETYFDSIFVISHESYMKETILHTITVRKNEDGFSEIINAGPVKDPEWTEKFS